LLIPKFQTLNLNPQTLNLARNPKSLHPTPYIVHTQLTQLEELDLFGAKITDTGAVHLKYMPRLTSLELYTPNPYALTL
jgi:hypothetical protein